MHQLTQNAANAMVTHEHVITTKTAQTDITGRKRVQRYTLYCYAITIPYVSTYRMLMDCWEIELAKTSTVDGINL